MKRQEENSYLQVKDADLMKFNPVNTLLLKVQLPQLRENVFLIKPPTMQYSGMTVLSG